MSTAEEWTKTKESTQREDDEAEDDEAEDGGSEAEQGPRPYCAEMISSSIRRVQRPRLPVD